jgi:hypothetical protein
MKIIFLDFDGVMDTEYYDHLLSEADKPIFDEYGLLFDPECVKNLKYIVDNTGADIVVSSTWKDIMSYEEIHDMWKCRRLPGHVTDVTPSTENHKRGDEIDGWLKECHTECNYVIIDDLDVSNFNEHQIPRLLIVNPFNGLDEYTAKRAVMILNATI